MVSFRVPENRGARVAESDVDEEGGYDDGGTSDDDTAANGDSMDEGVEDPTG